MKLTCFRISNGALAAKDLPARLKILAWGENAGIRGVSPRLGAHTLAAFARNMKRENFDRCAVDFEHNTVRGTPFFDETCEPRKVAGYGVPLLEPGDGLYLDAVDWTPCGRENALNYIDLSPAVHIDPKTGEVDFLHSVALTRAGALEGLSFFSVETQSEGDDAMDWKKWLCGWLGKPEDTEDAVLSTAFGDRIKALCVEAAAALNAEIDAISQKLATLSGAAQGAAPEALTTLSATVCALQTELGALKAEAVRRDREALCAQAAREGKVIPLSAEQIAATDLTVLRDMVGKLPVTVPLDRRTPERIQTLSAETVTPALDRVARRCGLDPKKVLKANKA